MKTVFPLACALAYAGSLHAQYTAVLRRFPARSPEVEIRNEARVKLTAFAIRMDAVPGDRDAAPFLHYVDAAVDSNGSLPLAPGEKYAVAVTSGFRGGRPVDLFAPSVVTAAVFADGSTSGDSALLARLMQRRRSMVQALELARDILSDAGRRNVSRGALMEQFRMRAESVSHWYLPPEQQVGRKLYQSISEELRNLPPLQAASAFPPAAYVEAETAQLDRRRTMVMEAAGGLGR